MKQNSVIVVGAGIAGLSAAYELQKRGTDVLVLEAASRVGGRMMNDVQDGYILDGGAQFLSSAYPILSRYIHELGLASEFAETSAWAGVVRGQRIRSFRYDKPFSLWTGGLLKFREWLSLGMGSFRLLKATRQIPTSDYAAWAQYDDEATDHWSYDWYGKGVTDSFIEPMLEAFYFQAMEETSRALPIALNAYGAHKARTMTLTEGMGSLPRRMAASLDIRFGTAAERVMVDGDEVVVVSGAETFRAAHVILAVPAYVTQDIYNPEDETETDLIKTQYSSTVNIAIALKNKHSNGWGLGEVYGIWIPRTERQKVAAITIESHKHPHRAASGELINVMLSGEAGAEMVEMDDEAILAEIMPELEAYLPGLSKDIAFVKVYHWSHAEPMSPVGRSQKIKQYRESLGQNPRVILAGDYMGMPFTEGAAETGVWAASRIGLSS